MRHIHVFIVSRHLATRGNNKILCAPPPHIISSEEILPRITRRSHAQLRIHKSPSNHTYTKSTLKHINQQYAHSVTSTYTTHIVSSTAPTYAPIATPGFVDRPRWGGGAADQKWDELSPPHKQESR